MKQTTTATTATTATTTATKNEVVISKNHGTAPLSMFVLGKNPRKDLLDIKGLANTIIGANGILEDLTVKKSPEGLLEVINGQRRFTAAKLIEEMGGHENIVNNIPFKILEKGTSEVDLTFLQILANEGEPLKPLELAEAVNDLAVAWELKTAEIADRLGRSKVYVNELKRLAVLPENIKALINNGTLSATLIRQQMKAGTLEDFIKQIEEGGISNFEQGEEVESDNVEGGNGGKQSTITAKDIPTINSLKDFKRFAKAFSEIFPQNKTITIQEAYELLTGVLHNTLDYEYFLNFFTDETTKAQFIEKNTKKVDKNTNTETVEPAKKTKKSKAAKQEALKEGEAKTEGSETKTEGSETKPEAPAAKPETTKAATKAPAKGKAPKAKEEAKEEPKAAAKKTGRVIGFDKKAAAQAEKANEAKPSTENETK